MSQRIPWRATQMGVAHRVEAIEAPSVSNKSYDREIYQCHAFRNYLFASRPEISCNIQKFWAYHKTSIILHQVLWISFSYHWTFLLPSNSDLQHADAPNEGIGVEIGQQGVLSFWKSMNLHHFEQPLKEPRIWLLTSCGTMDSIFATSDTKRWSVNLEPAIYFVVKRS